MQVIFVKTGHILKKSNTISPWFFWGIGALFYMYQFIIRVSPSVFEDEWLVWFSIDTAVLGTIVSMYYFSYSWMQVPLGVLFDKFGPRILISVAGLICSVGLLLIVVSNSIFLAGFARLLMGLGSACGFLGTLKIATLCFPSERIGAIGGITTAFGTVGGIIGGAPLSYLGDCIGWKGAMIVLSVIGLVISLVAWFSLSKLHHHVTKSLEHKHLSLKDLFAGVASVVKSPYAWKIALFAFCMYAPLSAFADLWAIPFLKDTYGFKKEYAAFLLAFMFVGVIVGGFLLDTMIRRYGDEKAMVMGGIGSFASIVVVIYVPLPDYALMFALFLSGFFFAPECIAFGKVCTVVPEKMGGTAVGFTNMITMFSGFLLQPLIGFILKLFNPGEFGAHVTVDPFHYHVALTIIPICLGIATLIAIQLKKEARMSRQ